MKSLTAKLVIILTALVTMPSFATVQTMTIGWDKYNDGTAFIGYKKSYSTEVKYFQANIGHSIAGNQGIFFDNHYISNKNMCSFNSYSNYSNIDTTTMIFNGQAVKMLRFCRKFTDTNQTYYRYTPETNLGRSYVINLFKTSRTPIKVQFNDETLYVPVKGFTKAWNSAGGNAI